MIEYTSPTHGYSGKLYGKSSMSIYNPDGDEVMHTGSRTAQTLNDLMDLVENYPKFEEMIRCNLENY